MTETEIAGALIASFRNQTALYGEMESLNLQCENILKKQKKIQPLLPYFRLKDEKLRFIARQCDAARPARDEWESRKSDWQNAALRLQVEESFKELKAQLEKNMESDRRLEEMVRT